MKLIPKTRQALLANKAESMAEVVVAFMVLTIVMSLFAQGMKFALTAENYAIGRTRDSDKAMREMLDAALLNAGSATSVGTDEEHRLDDHDDLLRLRIYTVSTEGGGDNCIYFVYDANLDD